MSRPLTTARGSHDLGALLAPGKPRTEVSNLGLVCLSDISTLHVLNTGPPLKSCIKSKIRRQQPGPTHTKALAATRRPASMVKSISSTPGQKKAASLEKILPNHQYRGLNNYGMMGPKTLV